MSTVYAVSSGDYSDYSVDRIFEAREDAERYVDARNRADGLSSLSSYFVEEMEFHPRGTGPRLWTRHHVFIALSPIGIRSPGDIWDWAELEVGEPSFTSARFTYSDMTAAVSTGPDLERCRKSCRDFYARHTAEREGIS
jgi:hypothetical protein